MRWFVDVSRIDENAEAKRYCVEAKQWQAALQEARKLLGDAGPLSKFSIELLDEGYRAVDPSMKVRYLVAKAPQDSPLSTGVANGGPSSTSAAAEPVGATSQRAPKTTQMSGAPLSGSPSRPALSNVKEVSRTPASKAAPSPAAGSSAKKEVPAVSSSAAKTAPARPSAPSRGPSEHKPLPSTHPTQPSLEANRPPDFQLVRKREEEPRPQAPITYREYAYAVKPGTDRHAAELLLWSRFNEIRATIEDRASGKFVQLAVFDHLFEKKPLRPPLATLAWKDWRGDPVIQFPGAAPPAAQARPAGPTGRSSGPSSSRSAPRHAAPSPPSSFRSTASVPASAPAGSSPHHPPPPSSRAASHRPDAAAPTRPASALVAQPPPVPIVAPSPPASGPSSAPSPARPSSPPIAPSAPSNPVAAPAPFSTGASTSKSSPSSSAATSVPLSPPSVPDPPAAVPAAFPPVSPARTAAPAAPVAPAAPAAPVVPLSSDVLRSPEPQEVPIELAQSQETVQARRSGEDLISELFEVMHELHFMPDLVSGAQFLLGVLDKTLPCAAVLVHVFDINTGHFVVVRAKSPGGDQVLLHRTGDHEPLFSAVMRRMRTLRVDDARAEEGYSAERWQLAGLEVESALCGPVQQGGRYLGMIELVNPADGGPFDDAEANALDYICEQFAEFLANRPIVVDADVVLPKS